MKRVTAFNTKALNGSKPIKRKKLIVIDDQNYWNKFYQLNGLPQEPSFFAQYVEDKYLTTDKTLLELGCGNGRDAISFAKNGKKVSALDLSSQTIQNLSLMDVKNAQFFNQDFSKLSDFKNFDYVYSRFTFHAIDEKLEKMVLSQLPKVLKKGGLFFLEARSLKDEKLEKTFGFTHFRRYLDFEATVEKIEMQNFKVLEKIESQGLSPYKKEDPFLIRVVAEKL